jgi:hypothetical protein
MPNTGDILIAMRDDLAQWMQQRGYGNAVYITEAPFDELVSQYAIQIIPTPDTAAHPNSGIGLVRSGVDIVIWWRGLLDPMQRGTQRIAGQTGVQPFADVLREYLVQKTFGGLMLVPLTFRNGGVVTAVPEMDGWLTVRDSYEYGYEMTWS